jgi:hypothetical protein
MLTSVLNKQTPRTAGESLVYNALRNTTTFTNPPAISANTAVVSNTSLYVAGTDSNSSNYLYNVPFTANGTFPTSNASYSNGLIQGLCLNPSNGTIRYASSYISNAERYIALVDACLNFSTSTYVDDITSLTSGTPGNAVPLAFSVGASNATFVGAGSTLYLGTTGLTTATTAVLLTNPLYSYVTTTYSNTGFGGAYNSGTGNYTFTISSGTIATLSNGTGWSNGVTVVVSGFENNSGFRDSQYNGSFTLVSFTSTTITGTIVPGSTPESNVTNLSNGVISYSNTVQTFISNQSIVYTVSNSALFRPNQAITITGAGTGFNYTSVPVKGIYSSNQIMIANGSNVTSTASFTSSGTVAFNSYVPVNSPDGYSILAAGPAAYFPGVFGDARIPFTSVTATATTQGGLGPSSNLTSRLVNYTCACKIPALYGNYGSAFNFTGTISEGSHIVIAGYTGSDISFNASSSNNGDNTTAAIGALMSYNDTTQVIQVYANSNVTNGSSPASNTGYGFFPITPVSNISGTTYYIDTTVGLGGFPPNTGVSGGSGAVGIYGQTLGFQPVSWNNSLTFFYGPGKRQAVAASTPGGQPNVYGTIQVGGYGAQFDVYVMSNSTNSGQTLSYFVQMLNAGYFYSSNMQVVLLGTNLGGTTPANDLKITVTGVNSGTNYSITSFTFTGTPAATAVSLASSLTGYIYSNISPATVPYIQSNANYSITGVVPTGYNISNTAVLYSTSSNFFSPYNLSNGLSNATVNGYGSSASGGTSNFSNTGLFVISNLGGYNEKVFSTVGKVVRSVPLSIYSAFANITYSAGANNTFTLYALQSNVSNSYQKIVVAVSGTVTTPTGSQTASYTNPWFVSNSPIGTLIQPTVTMSSPDTIVIDSSSGFVYMLDTTSNIYRATTNVIVSNTTYNGVVYPGTTIGGATMTSAFGIPSTLFVSTAIGGANVLYSVYSYPITATNIAGMYVFSVTPGY